MRATLSDAGIPQAAASYDAWGVPETPAIASFGFTGELQHGSDVWLWARWYGAGRGSFGSRDPWAGEAQTPYSLQYYQYGYSNPVLWTDASGYDPGNPPQPINTPCTPFTFDTPNNSGSLGLAVEANQGLVHQENLNEFYRFSGECGLEALLEHGTVLP